ncbi:MAG: hypothetical protein IPL55_24085 [Saprospiraceae bacterium]|nr:hypothetical protein [Saprospiraceae bacterium]
MSGNDIKHLVLWQLIFLQLLTVGCKNKEPKFSIKNENHSEDIQDFPALKKLSDYKKFILPLAGMKPEKDVILYDLNSSLFSDYAHKKRFIYLPEGASMTYHPDYAFDFPEGSMIFKFFYYPADFRNPDKNIRIIETRVLIKVEMEWQSLTYIWNEEQTDAFLTLAGESKSVTWIDESGKTHDITYSVPGMLVCKSCHEFNSKIAPIGPAARHLNKPYFADKEKNQLKVWVENKKLIGMPELSTVPRIALWENTKSDINDRSRAYLDINCSHCHRKEGPAKNSGLYLLADESNNYAYGIKKTPVAAGRGSGNLKYDIDPGNPEASILVFRMKSLEPGIMMPEAGRRTRHEEGILLISEWIKKMTI